MMSSGTTMAAKTRRLNPEQFQAAIAELGWDTAKAAEELRVTRRQVQRYMTKVGALEIDSSVHALLEIKLGLFRLGKS